ncbi:putative bifunctional diguanylate cyclase/phosphodiesterase [Xanthobacter sp. ZOL 2024]
MFVDEAVSAAQRRGAPVFFIAIGVLIVICVLAGASWLTHSLYVQSHEEHRRELRNLALTLANQTERSLQGLELVQRSMAERIAAAEISTQQQLRSLMGTPEIHQLMREKISGLPQVDAVTIIDRNGDLVSFSRRWPTPMINVAMRDYFTALSAEPAPTGFISTPVRSIASGAITIYVAHRLNGPDGRFLGLVLGAMQQASFEHDFSTIELGASGLIALVRNDGTVLARVPASVGSTPQPDAGRARIAALLLQNLPDDGAVPENVLDAQKRIVAVQPLAHHPLAVVVSDTADGIDHQAWKAILPIGIAALLVCWVVGLIVFLVVRQIARERAFAEQERVRACTDALTGLPNRLAFTEELTRRLKGEAPTLALLFIDLDYFKTINDTLGHDVGDTLLQGVAQRLRGVMPAQSMVARLGGDEFAVVCRQCADETEAKRAAQRLIEALREPFDLTEHKILTGCSVGIALAPRDGSDVATLFKCADLALYQAKGEGRGNAQHFHPDLSISAQARRQLEIDLDTAWREHEFSVVYQPIFAATTGRLAGFEALLRWHHLTRGDVPPEQFIPVIEESGLILQIGKWILEEACQAATAWPEDVFISVNVSPAQFRGGRAEQDVEAALAHSGLAPQRLELEITESLLLQADAPLRRILDRFRARGLSLALDDFGTGYSSLRYLRDLNVSRLKIDQGFIAHVVEDRHTFAVVRAIISLGLALDLEITAEGIETQAQAQLLREEGCTHLQGFLLGPPMSADSARALATGTRTGA